MEVSVFCKQHIPFLSSFPYKPTNQPFVRKYLKKGLVNTLCSGGWRWCSWVYAGNDGRGHLTRSSTSQNPTSKDTWFAGSLKRTALYFLLRLGYLHKKQKRLDQSQGVFGLFRPKEAKNEIPL
jgi:hypothetical protein